MITFERKKYIDLCIYFSWWIYNYLDWCPLSLVACVCSGATLLLVSSVRPSVRPLHDFRDQRDQINSI